MHLLLQLSSLREQSNQYHSVQRGSQLNEGRQKVKRDFDDYQGQRPQNPVRGDKKGHFDDYQGQRQENPVRGDKKGHFEAVKNQVERGNGYYEQLSRYQPEPAPQSLKDVGMGQYSERREQPSRPHIDENQKRNLYEGLKNRVKRGERMSEKQKHAYQLLSLLYGDERDDGGAREVDSLLDSHHNKDADGRRPVPVPQPAADRDQEPPVVKDVLQTKHHQDPAAPLPPVPANNNEQEEVKDLLDGQQKFDNLKDSQRGGGEDKGVAGVPDGMAGDEGVELHRGDENQGAVNVKALSLESKGGEEHAQPPQHPVPEGGNLENNNMPHPPVEKVDRQPVVDAPVPGGVGGNEDDEDAGADYRGEREEREDERNKVKEPEHRDVQFEVYNINAHY